MINKALIIIENIYKICDKQNSLNDHNQTVVKAEKIYIKKHDKSINTVGSSMILHVNKSTETDKN